MIIKKTYDEDYIIMKVTDIKTNENGTYTTLIGKLIDEKGCNDFRLLEELILHLTDDVEVLDS